MTTVVITCRQCGQEYSPTRVDIVRGPAVYRTCSECRTESPEHARCRECGRPLAGTRDVCLRCMGVPL
jgi:predicted amidophosphoribosyltransferase